MPQFSSIAIEEAQRLTGISKRERELAAYLVNVNELSTGAAGKVVPSEGETLATVRRRLGDAIRRSGRDFEIKRTDDAVYYWVKAGRRRGRRRIRPG